MPFRFSNPDTSPYAPGSIFLGTSDTGQKIGIKTERHIITIAGSRSGKGAALLIPNLLDWPHNALVIDPKGENAEATWQAREAMGQTVHVLDPFRIANVPDRLRASFNPLARLDPKSLTAREDIRVIADGLVMRHKAEDAMWDNGAVSVLAGIIAFAADNDPDGPNLPAVRRLLRLPASTPDNLPEDAKPPPTLQMVFEDMAASDAFGGLAQAGAAIGLGSERSAREFVKGARDNTEWLDSAPVAACLSSSTFDLSELKTGKATVYLVLPPQYLDEHGRFLRLFVRCALNEMAKGGRQGSKCLFMLDEFFSLGHISEIAKAAGLMPGYGVQLWPFLQDIGQLQKLYGREGAETFFGNADAHIFFGNTDTLTLDYISAKAGSLTPDEITTKVPKAPRPISEGWGAGFSRRENELRRARYEREQANYRHVMGQGGKPRLAPDEIRQLVGKGEGDKVARSMIVFGTGNSVFNLLLAPYFEPRRASPKDNLWTSQRPILNRLGTKLLSDIRDGLHPSRFALPHSSEISGVGAYITTAITVGILVANPSSWWAWPLAAVPTIWLVYEIVIRVQQSRG